MLKATDYDDWEGLGYRSKSEDLQNVKSSTVAFEERAAVRMRYLFINMFF